MDFALTDDQQEIATLARRIFTDHSAPEKLREMELRDDVRFDRTLWGLLAEAGLLGLHVPQAAGGAGLGLVELGEVLRAAGAAAAAVPVWECLGLGATALMAAHGLWVNDILRGVVDGSVIVTGAYHEPNLDPLEPATTATAAITSDGTGEVVSVNGTKVCVPAAQLAAGFVVCAKSGEEVGLFYVDANDVGVTVNAHDTTSGTPDGEVVFSNAIAKTLVAGHNAVRLCYEQAVATQTSFILGICEASLDLTSTYTTERHQFGVPLASFQAVGHRAADAYIDTEGVRLTGRQALWALDSSLPASDVVAIAQDWAASAVQRVVHTAVHLHGGVGVDTDYPLARHFTMAKQMELQLGGSTSALRNLGRIIGAS